jgi:hypothetical protein
MDRRRLYLTLALWAIAIAAVVVITGAAIGWALLGAVGIVAACVGVVLLVGGRRRPVLGAALVVAGTMIAVLGIAELAMRVGN